jgi:hypothetical protein
VTLTDFRRLVHQEFGGDLRHMTPANVRDFLSRVQPRIEGEYPTPGRVQLNEPEGTYEGIVRDFLRRVLDMPPEQAIIRLWLYSLEMTMASVSDLEAEKFQKLFAHLLAEGADPG